MTLSTRAIGEVSWGDYTPALLAALERTLAYTALGFSAAVGVGMIIAVVRLAPVAPLRAVAKLYTETFKNLPLITEIYILYFGLASLGVRLNTFQAGSLALALFYGAYLSEIFRGGLQSVPPGQREAAQVLGLTPLRAFRYVTLPQAVRVALPGTSTMMVDLLKGTSLMVAIGGGELMTQGTLIASDTFQAMEVYLVIGLIYLAMCYPLAQLALFFERRMRAGAPLSLRRRRTRQRITQSMTAFTRAG
jgi:polar amino acid transport system permease protein